MKNRHTLKRAVLILASTVAATSITKVHDLVGQDAQPGTIQGIVTREGSTEPIPGAQITVTLRGSLAATGFTAQQVLQAANRGANVSPELVQTAQAATRGGPGATLANAPALTTTTDNAGHFAVLNVPAGEALIRAQLQNYFGPLANGRRAPIASESVVVARQQTAEVRLSLVKGGTISGRVLDASGKPLENAPVQALQRGYDNGVPSLQVAIVKPTDDRGEFRLGILPPGEYYVAVTPVPAGARGATPQSAVSDGQVAVPTLYPNATESAQAGPVVLQAGSDVSGIDIQLRTVQGAKVSGRVTHTLPAGPAPGGRGGTRPLVAVLSLAPQDPSELPDIIGVRGGITADDNGNFEIANVPPGSYDLFARLPIADGWGGLAPPERATTPLAFGRTTVEVRSGNVEDVSVVVHQGIDVKGRITVDGQAPAANTVRLSIAPDDSATRVSETQISNVFGQINQYPPRIEQDGSFTIPVLPEGHYRIYAIPRSLPDSSYVADIRQGAASIYDTGLTVGRESLNPIDVTVLTNGGSVEGAVLNSERKAVPRASVVLVPPPNHRSNLAMYKVVQSDAQGHYLIKGVAPGAWKVFAWESVQEDAFKNAEFMQKYETRGASVTVSAGARSNADVTLIRN